MNKKLLSYAVVPVIGAALAAGTMVSAQGLAGRFQANPDEMAQRQSERFSKEAELLGVSVDDVKNAWAQGKSLPELAKEKGISEDTLKQKLNELRKQAGADRLKALVDKGVITQAQADERAKFMEANTGKMYKGPKGMMHRGGHPMEF